MMKKQFLLTYLVAALFVCIQIPVDAQQNNRQGFGNEFWEKRNAFIVAEIHLTAEEASKFIPLENEFKHKMLEVGRDCRGMARESQSKQKMTGAEYTKLIDCYLDNRIKEAQIEKEYFEKFKKILTPEKLYKYHEADAKLARELINSRRTAPQDRSNPTRPPERNTPNRQPRNTR